MWAYTSLKSEKKCSWEKPPKMCEIATRINWWFRRKCKCTVSGLGTPRLLSINIETWLQHPLPGTHQARYISTGSWPSSKEGNPYFMDGSKNIFQIWGGFGGCLQLSPMPSHWGKFKLGEKLQKLRHKEWTLGVWDLGKHRNKMLMLCVISFTVSFGQSKRALKSFRQNYLALL